MSEHERRKVTTEECITLLRKPCRLYGFVAFYKEDGFYLPLVKSGVIDVFQSYFNSDMSFEINIETSENGTDIFLN